MKQWMVNKMLNNLYLMKCKHVDDWKSRYGDIIFFVGYEFLYMMQILSTYTIQVSWENMKETSIITITFYRDLSYKM